MTEKKRLGEVLLEAGVINETQLSVALQSQKSWGGKLGSTLVRMGFVREEDILGIISKQLGFPAVDFSKVQVSPKALRTIPVNLAEKYNIIPAAVKESGNKKQVVLVTADPTNIDVISEIEFQTGFRIRPVVATETAIARAIDQKYHSGSGPSAATGVTPDVVQLEEISEDEEMVVIEHEDTTFSTSESLASLESDELLRLLIRLLIKKGVINRAELSLEIRKRLG